MTVLPKAIYSLSAIIIKIPMACFFCRNRKPHSKIDTTGETWHFTGRGPLQWLSVPTALLWGGTEASTAMREARWAGGASPPMCRVSATICLSKQQSDASSCTVSHHCHPFCRWPVPSLPWASSGEPRSSPLPPIV